VIRRAAQRLGAVIVVITGSVAALAGAALGQQELEQTIEEMDLQTLLQTPIDVWTASKVEQKIREAPAIVTTITREQIAVWGHRSIAELLSHVVGFYVVDDHISPNLAVRGTSGGLYAESSIVKVLIDGHPVSFWPTAGNALGPELIPLTAVDRVEIIRGPASALFGADAFLGVINVKTREGQGVNGGHGWVATGQVGDHLATDVDLALGAAHGMADVMVAFRRTRQDLSGLELPASSPAPSVPGYNFGARVASGLDQETTTGIFTLTLRPAASAAVKLYAYYAATNRGAEFGSLYQLAHGFNERNTFSENRVSRWQVSSGLLWDQEITARLKLSVRGSYFQGGPGDDDRLEVGSEFYYVRRRFDFRGLDSDVHAAWAPVDRLRLVAGGSFFLDDEQLPSRLGVAKQPVEGIRAGEVVSGLSISQGRETFLNAGAYLQGTWEVKGPLLGVTGGLRYDQHNVYGAQLSRRVGLVSSPRPDLNAKLLHGTAFKAPSALLLHAVPSAAGDVVGNAGLRPQYVDSFEGQVSYQPGAVTLTTGVAYNLVRDKTEFVQLGINKVARNVARSATLSWESLVELQHRQWLRAYLSGELQRTVQRTGQDGYVGEVVGREGNIYPGVMVHAGVAGQPLRSPVRAALSASWIGRRRASGNNIVLAGGPYTLPPYVLLDANITTVGFHLLRERSQEVSLSLSGKNLLGARGPAPGFSGVDYPLAPRAFFLQVNLIL
jgi:outer membrane receptor for ferrienterochelin and colicins